MKLIITLFITLAISVSILTYLQPEIFNGLASVLFSGEIWNNAIALLAVFGGFFTRLFNNTYISLLVGVNLIFYVLRLFVNFITSRHNIAFNTAERENIEKQEMNIITDESEKRTNSDSKNNTLGSTMGDINNMARNSRVNSSARGEK